MKVHVLHHGSCFDGAVSSAVFGAFARRHFGGTPQIDYRPRDHRPGNPFAEDDFDADEVAILDFRYAPTDRLTWFFDHHVSAFQLPGEREHFAARAGQAMYHDIRAPSCAHLVAKVLLRDHGMDLSAFQEILEWADIIDTASFRSPTEAVSIEHPALVLMTFVERNQDREVTSRFIEDLSATAMADLARADYIQAVVEPARHQQRADLALVGERARAQAGVVTLDLSDQPPRSYNKFLAYAHHPRARYVVTLSVGPRGRLRLSAGYNPWLPPQDREHDIAAICEAHGGGGHPFVGGVSFPPQARARAVMTQHQIARILRGEQAAA